MKQPKDKYEHITKTAHIQWTVMQDKAKDERKATFYVLSPQYHSHPWTACTALIAPSGRLINIFGHQLESDQTAALARVLSMAAKWLNGKRLAGKRIDAAVTAPDPE